MVKFIDEQKHKNDIGIYKIVNLVNGKVYVGQTKERFQRRYWLHQWKLRNGSHDNSYLQRAWDKYGEENFSFEIIEILSKEEIDEREKYWIAYHRETTGCYSIQDGGQPENLGDYVSAESRKRTGELNRQRLLGSKLPDSTKKKMSDSRKGKRIYRTNDKLTDEQAILIKTLFVEGKKSRDIQKITNVPYKEINGILSSNHYCTLAVDGWDEFIEEHRKETVFRKERGKQIMQELTDGASIESLAEKYNLHKKSIEYYQKKLNKH